MPIKILIADDSASDRMIIKSMLSEYTILTACDGMEAMQVLERDEGINILILDINMPNMNGFQVLESLNNDEGFRKIRTIVLTNQDELDNEIRGLELGAVDYIRKPIHMASLKARIDVHVALLRAEQALEQQLDEQTLTFDMVFEQAPIGIAITYRSDSENSTNTIIRINKAYEQITGITKEDLIESGWVKLTHLDDLEEDMNNFTKLQAGEINSYSMEKRYIKPDGSLVWVHMVVAALAPIRKYKLNHICLIQDITERKQIEIERKYLSEHDRWTGLYNREYLEDFLAKDAKHKLWSKRALIGINLSSIQSLTANYGFIYTQGLIKRTSQVLMQLCSNNRLLFQTHESRFVFYFSDYRDKKELIEFCDAIADTLESLFATDRIGGGIGVLEIDQAQNKLEIDILLRRLLIASERSISMFGKYFEICFYDEILEDIVSRERFIIEALTAITTDTNTNDELFLQYHPIMNLETGTICGFEALARLNTNKHGLISPVEFIPVAEKSKLIIPIGEKVIVKAFNFINKLMELGYNDIVVSINISPIQLLSPNFTDRLFELIDQMQVNLRNISIEITESVFASDYEYINNIIEVLRDAGMHISIDDFGTGYSSLSRVKELKVDSLKIDKSFIDNLLDPDQNKAITGDIISMAHKLGHSTIAEGVEYEEQKEYLKKHGCDKIQGYLMSKPLDEKDAIEFLQKCYK